MVTTVAVSRSEDYLAANAAANPLVVLNEGFQSAFLACVALAGIGVALALLLPGRPRTARQQHLDSGPGDQRRGLSRGQRMSENTRGLSTHVPAAAVADTTNERRTKNGKDRDQ